MQYQMLVKMQKNGDPNEVSWENNFTDFIEIKYVHI